MKVVFFGSPSFAAKILDYLFDQKIKIAAIVTKPDRPKGRSLTPVFPPVKQVALEKSASIPILQPESSADPSFVEQLRVFNADLFVVVAYGEILKQNVLSIPKLGCINVHPSLLPKYRGATPIQNALLNGDTETGVTIMHMVKKMDAGDIIEMSKVSIAPEMTFGELEETLCEVAKKLLVKVIHDFFAGKVKSTPQDHSMATFCKKIELEDCEIRWTEPAVILHNLVRASNPYPGAWCYVTIKGEKKRLKIFRTQVIPSSGLPGSILNHPQQLIIATGNQALRLLEVQLEGKRLLSADDFLRGIPKNSLVFVI